MRFRTRAAAGAAAALILVGTVPATALDHPIDIRVETDLPDLRVGPLVLEVLGVTPGDGPELTGANVIANPSAWLGTLRVDVDPVAETVTIDSDEVEDFRLVTVRITSTEIADLALLSNTLGRHGDSGLELSYVADGTDATLTWVTDTPNTSYDLDGSAVFTWSPTFTDVRGAHPFFQQIEWLTATGIATGYADGTFGPGRTISRQAMASFLHKMDQIMA